MHRFAQGRTTVVYDLGDGTVCKLFPAGYPRAYIEHEYRNAVRFRQIGLPAPKAFGLIERDGRTGILYEKLSGRTLRQCTDEAAVSPDDALRLLAGLHARILRAEGTGGMDYRDVLLLVNGDGLRGEIEALPDGDRLLHGDLHPGNIILDERGEPHIIDFMNVCCGPALYDIARTYFLTGAKSYLTHMHATKNQIEPFLAVLRKARERTGF